MICLIEVEVEAEAESVSLKGHPKSTLYYLYHAFKCCLSIQSQTPYFSTTIFQEQQPKEINHCRHQI